MMPTQHQIAADRRPPVKLAMTYLVEGIPRTGTVCHYQRGTGSRMWQVCDDLPPYVWRTLMLDDRRIVAPAEYRRPT